MHKYLILDESGKPLFRAVMRQALHGGVCRAELENEEDVEKLVPGGLFQLMGIRDGNFAEVRFLRGRGETAEFEMVRMLDSGTRQNLRIPVRFESFLYPVSGSWKGRAAIVSRDLSCGGIAFVSEKALQVGEICEIVIPVTAEPLVLKMKVLRSGDVVEDGILYGAQFLGMVHEEEIMVREAVFGLQLELDRDPADTLPSV